MLMGLREYARHRGVTLRAVQKAIATGRIKTDDNKKIDAAAADRAWELNSDVAKQSMARPLSSAATNADAPLMLQEPGAAFITPPPYQGFGTGPSNLFPLDEDRPDPDSDSAIYRQWRAQREKLRAEREHLELEQFKGVLIDADEAKRMAFTSFRALRDALLNVPARIKDQCAAETDALKIEKMIEDELSLVMAGFDATRALQDVDEDDAD